jgi:two-component system chemotaxis sensor kinase CheA
VKPETRNSKPETRNSKPETAFHKKLLATFRVEAAEHLKAMTSGLIELEGVAAPEAQVKIIETVLREAHSLKGAARAVTQTAIEAVCQSLESVLVALKRQELGLSAELFDILHQVMDNLHSQLSAFEAAPGTVESPRIASLLRVIEGVIEGVPPATGSFEAPIGEGVQCAITEPEPPRPEEAAAGPRPISLGKPWLTETVRIPAARLDALLLQAEELISAKLTASQRATELHALSDDLAAWKKQWARVYPDLRTIRQWLEKSQRDEAVTRDGHLGRLLEFLDWASDFIKSQESALALLAKSTDQDQRSLAAMVDHLLEETKKVRMMPCASLLEIFPQVVRGLSRDRGKEVELVMRGGEIEVDRRILEEMKDALMHLVRNCIDHGIENPEERVAKGKPPRGTLTIAISPGDGNKVEILVADDGAGIDVGKVLDIAVKIGVLTRDEAARMSAEEALLLAFHSGVSTSPLITDISGRGLGLAIVREKVELLRGTISVESRPDHGATFRTVLPITLAAFRGIPVRAEEQLFVLPTTNVERVLRVSRSDVQTVENRETVSVDGHAVSLVALGDVLELPGRGISPNTRDTIQAVLLASAEKRIAFLVDEVVNEQEVLVKDLGKQLARVRNVAGATITGAGEVVPLLNATDLMKSALKSAAAPAVTGLGIQTRKVGKKSILVVEDSITSRMLLKNILESAGYQVKTAVDGIDALTILRAEMFDILVSDVDMPRMNGLDLTAKIRADKKWAELPVVLVTALGTREDRERGLDVGANAYIVKSDFDQSNLLEVIRRLV